MSFHDPRMTGGMRWFGWAMAAVSLVLLLDAPNGLTIGRVFWFIVFFFGGILLGCNLVLLPSRNPGRGRRSRRR